MRCSKIKVASPGIWETMYQTTAAAAAATTRLSMPLSLIDREQNLAPLEQSNGKQGAASRRLVVNVAAI